MTASLASREKTNRTFEIFGSTQSARRSRHIFSGLLRESLIPLQTTREKWSAEGLLSGGFYLTSFSSDGTGLTRSIFGVPCFQAFRTGEESRHGTMLRERPTRSSTRSEGHNLPTSNRECPLRPQMQGTTPARVDTGTVWKSDEA